MIIKKSWKPKAALVFAPMVGALLSQPALAQEQVTDGSEEVIRVTGSRIRQIDVESSSSMTSYSREDIERSGYATVADFLRNAVPSAGLTTENATLSQVAGSASFGGRDFATEYTLVLLNGRRLPTNAIAADFVDLNLLPVAAVERIEYLTDGASAVYGSDAVAGVLNIITRKNFEGLSVSSRVGSSEDGSGVETSWEVVSGTTGSKSNFMIAADYFKRESVQAKDRPLIKSAIAPDGTDGRSPNGLPGYVINAAGNIEPFPEKNPCPDTSLDASGRCQYDFAPLYEAIPKSERTNIYTVFDYQLSDSMQAFAEARYSQAYTFNSNGAAPGAVPISGDSPVLDGTPWDGQNITLVRRYLDFGPRRTDNTNSAFSVIAGLRGDFNSNHSWSLEATTHRLKNLRVGAGGQINEPAVVEAFNDGVLDPFVFNTFDTEEKLAAYQSINTNIFREGSSRLQTYSLDFDGFLPVELDGGSLGYATGFEFRRESFLDRADNLSKDDKILGSAGSDGRGDRENEAAYIELLAPVLDNVDLNLAARYDQIDHDADAVTYKLAVSYKPLDNLKLRASYGTGFKAPNLHDLFLGTSFGVTTAIDPDTCSDPKVACEINTIQGGNRELEPEESVSYNLGVVSQLSDALSLSVDYWNINIENKVDQLSLQNILNNADEFADLINRDPNGRLNTTGAFVRTNLQNLTKENSAGVELQAKYSEKYAFGRVYSTLLLNKTVVSETQETATDPLCNFASNVKGPDGRLLMGWAKDALAADLVVRHFSSYDSYTGGLVAGTCDYANKESKYTVDSTTELDLQFSYTAPWDSQFALGVQNLADAEPAFDRNATWPWYSQARYSNAGRFFYASATHEFK